MASLATFPASNPEAREWAPISPGQAEFLAAADKELVASSPLGHGKSTLLAMKELVWCHEYQGSYNVMLRKHQADAVEHLVIAMRRVVGERRFDAGWNEQKARWIDPVTKSWVRFGGFDNPAKWGGAEIGLASIDEMVQPLGAPLSEGIEEDEWVGVLKRMRNVRAKVHQVCGATNPGPASHWILKRNAKGLLRLVFIEPGATREILRVNAPDYQETIDSLEGVQAARYRSGLWVDAEGLVYSPPFDRRVHVRDGIEPPEGYPVQIWIDWGFSHAFCALFAWKGSDQIWRVFDELHGRGKTVQEWAGLAKARLGARYPTNRVARTITDVDEDKQTTWKRYCPHGELITAEKSIEAGVDAVIDALRVDAAGNTHVYIAPRCVNLIAQLGALPWDARKDRPAKAENIEDDAADPFRYGIYTNRYGPKDGKRPVGKATFGGYSGGFSALRGAV